MKTTAGKQKRTPRQRSYCVKFANSEEWRTLAETAKRTQRSKNNVLREGLRLAAQQLGVEDTADA